MSKNFSRIKKALSMSTTMPAGTAGSEGWLMGSATLSHSRTHEHNHDGSCCDHHHNHSHSSGEQAKQTNEEQKNNNDEHNADDTGYSDDELDECDGDHTSPTGGCGCC